MLSTRVLLVEDDPVFRSQVERFLEQRRYQVTCAGSGEQGLELAKQHEFDVVLCDLGLPEMSGLDVLSAFMHGYAHLPVIVISGSEQMSDIREAVRLGAWDYLVKPVEQLSNIEIAIQNCLNRLSLEHSWERERWELDDHIDLLFDNDQLVEQLANDLTPHEPLTVGQFEINHEIDSSALQNYWVDYNRLPNNQALVMIASAQALTGKSLLSLLVLKTILQPIVRTASSNHPNMLASPHKMLERVNMELCHSRIKAAFDMVLIWLDGDSGAIHWGLAGEGLRMPLNGKPDLALGIWAHASYQRHQGKVTSNEQLSIGDGSTKVRIIHHRRQVVSAA